MNRFDDDLMPLPKLNMKAFKRFVEKYSIKKRNNLRSVSYDVRWSPTLECDAVRAQEKGKIYYSGPTSSPVGLVVARVRFVK